MINKDALRWFKDTFATDLAAAVQGTPFSVDLLVAIAAQETGEIWAPLRDKLPVAQLLEICVGDTLDENRGRRAFPRTHAHLAAEARGAEMLVIAHEALVAMSKHVPGYTAVAKNKNKFCHGYGVFQYDLQFFLTDPDYFLEKRWRTFAATLGKCLKELRAATARAGFGNVARLDDFQSVAVAIAYNTGRFVPSKGLEQGHQSPDGRFYGQNINDYLRMSKANVPSVPGASPLPPPSPVVASGETWIVDIEEAQLRVRREPRIDKAKPSANVIAHLPDGHAVRRVSGAPGDRFLEIETTLAGALIRGFAATKYLVKSAAPVVLEPEVPASVPPQDGVVEVSAPRKSGHVTRRRDNATALSLNEHDQPGRMGTTPEDLRKELWAIVDYLGVDKPAHRRYQPRDKLTFCNIYAHDYCTLAGVYLPRVWWNDEAIERLARGEEVAPALGATINEQTANALYTWLGSFGLRFGWRRTGTLTKLQQEANLGAVGLIIAKRKGDGSGHVAMVVPESEEFRAKRNAAGEVTAPLQSQAGASNFRFGTSGANWWNAEKFAESAFWIHA
jgi:hypothetical protein